MISDRCTKLNVQNIAVFLYFYEKQKENLLFFRSASPVQKNYITIVFHKIQQSRQQIFLLITPYFLKLQPFLFRYFSSHQKRRDEFYFTMENRKDMYLGFSFIRLDLYTFL